MTQMEERIRHLFGASIEAQIAVADSLSYLIEKAAMRLVNCLLNEGRILVCGHGGSAANCLHFSAAMLNHFEVERPPLPVIALSTDVSLLSSMTTEGHGSQVFARQIQALGQEGDVLLMLSTTGNGESLLQALHAANDRGMDTIALMGGGGGMLQNHLGPEDIELRVPAETSARIREIHLVILHCFCDLIEKSLFGPMLG